MVAEARVTIEFEATGEAWDRVESFTIDEDFFHDSDEWSVTVYSENPAELRRRFLPWSPVRVYLGDRLQCIGRIWKIQRDGATSLRVTGYDYLQDLVSSSIDPGLLISGSMTLEQALLAGFKPHGIDTIETTIDEVRAKKLGTTTTTIEERDNSLVAAVAGISTTLASGSASGLIVANALRTTRIITQESEPLPESKPKDSEGAFEWGKRLAARSGFTIQPGSARNALAVVVPDFNHEPVYQFIRNFDGTGNILSHGGADRDWTRVPQALSFRSRRLDTGLKMKANSRTTIPGKDDTLGFGQIREVQKVLEAANAETRLRSLKELGDTSKLYLPVYYRDDDSKDERQLERAKRRFLADRIKGVLTYSAPVVGHETPSGTGYAANTMAQVSDEIDDVDEAMWVQRKTLRFVENSGYQTTMQLILPAAYEL